MEGGALIGASGTPASIFASAKAEAALLSERQKQMQLYMHPCNNKILQLPMAACVPLRAFLARC
jgi:hypothetical protein